MGWLRRRRLRKMATLMNKMQSVQGLLRAGHYVGTHGHDYLREYVVKLERQITRLEKRI